MNKFTILFAIATILQSEACIPPIGGGGSVQTTTTTTAKPTTTKAPDCPMENINCLARDFHNLIEIKEVTSVKECSK